MSRQLVSPFRRVGIVQDILIGPGGAAAVGECAGRYETSGRGPRGMVLPVADRLGALAAV